MYPRARLLFLISFFHWFPVITAAQGIRLTGKVTNTKIEPLPGATVLIEGTSRQVVADVEGKFYISLDAGKNIPCVFQCRL